MSENENPRACRKSFEFYDVYEAWSYCQAAGMVTQLGCSGTWVLGNLGARELGCHAHAKNEHEHALVSASD